MKISKRTVIEQLTSKLMEELSQKYNTLFQLAIGDNFYFNGVTDSNDKRFQVKTLLIIVRYNQNTITYILYLYKRKPMKMSSILNI